MAKNFRSIALLAASFVMINASIAGALPIDTGYNYINYAAYPTPGSSVSTTQDNYWLNIASYPPTTPPMGPSWAIQPVGGWGPPPYAGSNWISARNSWSSAPGVSSDNPGYTIFRKCFCLAPNFNGASLSFRVRNDDSVHIYLNTVTNTLLGPVPGNFTTGSSLITATATQLGFLHADKNCLYAYLEDIGSAMGLDITGTFNANGLYPWAAAGSDQTFPCDCGGRGGPFKGTAVSARTAMQAGSDDQAVVSALIKIAEARRLARARKKR
jgi:hypothetical protein